MIKGNITKVSEAIRDPPSLLLIRKALVLFLAHNTNEGRLIRRTQLDPCRQGVAQAWCAVVHTYPGPEVLVHHVPNANSTVLTSICSAHEDCSADRLLVLSWRAEKASFSRLWKSIFNCTTSVCPLLFLFAFVSSPPPLFCSSSLSLCAFTRDSFFPLQQFTLSGFPPDLVRKRQFCSLRTHFWRAENYEKSGMGEKLNEGRVSRLGVFISSISCRLDQRRKVGAEVKYAYALFGQRRVR